MKHIGHGGRVGMWCCRVGIGIELGGDGVGVGTEERRSGMGGSGSY